MICFGKVLKTFKYYYKKNHKANLYHTCDKNTFQSKNSH